MPFGLPMRIFVAQILEEWTRMCPFMPLQRCAKILHCTCLASIGNHCFLACNSNLIPSEVRVQADVTWVVLGSGFRHGFLFKPESLTVPASQMPSLQAVNSLQGIPESLEVSYMALFTYNGAYPLFGLPFLLAGYHQGGEQECLPFLSAD